MLSLSIDSFHFYFLVAALQGFVLSLIIAFQKPTKMPHSLLGIMLFLFSLSLLDFVLEESIHLFNVKFPFPLNYDFVYGPLIYFHVKGIVSPHFKFSITSLVHLIPSFLIDVLFFILFFTYVRFNIEWGYAHIEKIQLSFLLISLSSFLHMLIYFVFAVRMLRKAQIKSERNASYITGWLKTFGIFWSLILAFLGVIIPWAIIAPKGLDDHLYILHYPLGALVSICIYWLGYRYLLSYRSKINQYFNRKTNTKYSSDEIARRKKQIAEALEVDKLFKNQKLSIESLAGHLGWSEKDVSQVIREGFGTNFNELINRYRIDAFKVMIALPENKKYSIAGIAKDVGFNSKASFYRAFKKICGKTPMEFLNNVMTE